MTQQNQALAPEGTGNPLLQDWSGPFGVPPFDRIEPAHFSAAFAHAYAEHAAEVTAIAADPASPASPTPSRRWSAAATR
jgi:peptidyl-dipeptidase Dcp